MKWLLLIIIFSQAYAADKYITQAWHGACVAGEEYATFKSQEKCERYGTCYRYDDSNHCSTYDLIAGIMVLNPTRVQEREDKKMEEIGLIQAREKRKCGERVIDIMGYRNVAVKGLTQEQIKEVVTSTSLDTIKQLLKNGALETAKTEIQAFAPDGTLITQGDKDAVIPEIDKCLGL